MRPLLQSDKVLNSLHALVQAPRQKNLVLVVAQLLVQAHLLNKFGQALHVDFEPLINLVDRLEARGLQVVGRIGRALRARLHILADGLLGCIHLLLEWLKALLLHLIEILSILSSILFNDS